MTVLTESQLLKLLTQIKFTFKEERMRFHCGATASHARCHASTGGGPTFSPPRPPACDVELCGSTIAIPCSLLAHSCNLRPHYFRHSLIPQFVTLDAIGDVNAEIVTNSMNKRAHRSTLIMEMSVNWYWAYWWHQEEFNGGHGLMRRPPNTLRSSARNCTKW